MPNPKLRVGLVGAGLIAREHHLPGWRRAKASVVGVADEWPAALAATEPLVPRAKLVPDYRTLLDDPSIDVIDICLPSALHADVTIAALEAGKHVLVEKPITTSRADAARVLAAWRTSGRKLMVGQQLRYDPGVLALRAHLQEHSPGQIYYGRAQWLRRRRLPGRPTFTSRALSGGGPLYDLGVHLLDLAWWMMGNPRPLSASGATYDRLVRRNDLGSEWGTWDPVAFDVEDFAAGLIRFEGGATLSLEASWLGLQRDEDMQRLQLYGTAMGIDWPANVLVGEENFTPWELKLAKPRAGEKPHRRLIREFAEAVTEDRPVPISPLHSAGVIAMLEALYRSSSDGREAAVEAVD